MPITRQPEGAQCRTTHFRKALIRGIPFASAQRRAPTSRPYLLETKELGFVSILQKSFSGVTTLPHIFIGAYPQVFFWVLTAKPFSIPKKSPDSVEVLCVIVCNGRKIETHLGLMTMRSTYYKTIDWDIARFSHLPVSYFCKDKDG